MKSSRASRNFFNISVTVLILCLCFGVCLILQDSFQTGALIPAIFVLGAFLTSVVTDGYIYGFISAILSIFAVNFAFTFPYFHLNFTIPENLLSAVIMILVSLMTCGLTTKLKKQEAMRVESEKERMRANLLRAISHDLRTPLTTIYGASSALLDSEANFTNDQKTKMLQGICQDAQWLSHMVENLLSITRLDNGNVKIIKTPTVLDELIDSVLIKFSKRYQQQEVIVNIPEEFVIIPMDALLIEQVLVNFLENAVQHAVGMTELTLLVQIISGKAIFEVRDNGAGISEERMRQIFTGYYTGEALPTDCKKNNAGIGLSVCATIIRAHGGSITAKNLSSQGAMFQFTLDMEEIKDEFE